MRYAFLFCFGLLSMMPWYAVAQDVYSMQGQVLDAETATPLVGAHVFLSNSTQGTVTDSTGHFVLDRLAAGTQEIAVSMLGFTLEVVRLTFPGDEQMPHVFRLKPRVLPMGEVVIAAARSEAEARNWERYIDTFTVHFIGETPNASKCTLLNPEVLYFTTGGPGRLEAAATEPLVIENRALGYRVYYHLQAFEAHDAVVRYHGTRRFELLPPRNRRERRRWERARKETYKGSLPHFLTTLLQDTDGHDVRSEGFTVGLS
ncbi:MAG TPA: carboxypeptidase-like regulatory domain-containing protein, partial [Rhodothermales bacterium]|nr:carboxypeptidase-like regulatory domain-containing protein [Rhodothermales bacterium]